VGEWCRKVEKRWWGGGAPKIVTTDSGEMVVVLRPTMTTNVLDWEDYSWKYSLLNGFAGQVMENDASATIAAIKNTVGFRDVDAPGVIPLQEAVRKACRLRKDDVVTMTIPPHGNEDKNRIITVYRTVYRSVYSQKQRWVRLCSEFSPKIDRIMDADAVGEEDDGEIMCFQSTTSSGYPQTCSSRYRFTP
jgi:hypothetical protein